MIPKKSHKRISAYALIEVSYPFPDFSSFSDITVHSWRSIKKLNKIDDLFDLGIKRFYVKDLTSFARFLFSYCVNNGHEFHLTGNLNAIIVNHEKKKYWFIDVEKVFQQDLNYQQLSEIVRFFFEKFNIDITRYTTVASTAVSLFRIFFQPAGLNNPFHQKKKNKNQDVLNRVERSLLGGRCEVYQLGEIKDVVYLDFNSFYPYIYTMPLPTNYVGTVTAKGNDLKNFLDRLGDDRLALVTGHVHVRETFLPPLPKKSSRLLFPCGCLNYTRGKLSKYRSWWNIELNHPMVQPLPREQYIVDLFTAKSMFRDYAVKLHELKKEATREGKQFFKLMMNSLWGKLAQRPFISEIYFKKGDIFSSNDTVVAVWDQGTFFERKIKKIKHTRLPHVGSAVTAYGRRFLLEMMEIGKNGLIYCDTDGFIVRKSYLKKYEPFLSDDLGALKIDRVYRKFRAFRERMYFGELRDGTLDLRASGYPHYHVSRVLERINTNKFDDIYDAITKAVTTRNVTLKEAIRFRRNPFDQKTIKYDKHPLKVKRRRTSTGKTLPPEITCFDEIKRKYPLYF